jgi:large repetitive protein
MGSTLVDPKDTFGRTTRHTDLSGRLYTYNQDGWLTDQASSAGQLIHTDYYANGYVKRITDNAFNTRTDYEYDAVGNRRHVWSYNNGLDGNISTQYCWYSFD